MDFFYRQGLLIPLLNDNNFIIVCSGSLSIRNGDSHYPFRVNSDFYYLTGIEEPEALLLLRLKNGVLERILIILNPSVKERIWDSAWRLTPHCHELSNYDRILSWNEQPNVADLAQECAEKMYHHVGLTNKAYKLLSSSCPPSDVLRKTLSSMRLIKSEHELQLIQQACDLSSDVYRLLFQSDKDQWTNEALIEGFWINEGKKRGALAQAYNPIIAGGSRSCCLHYQKNNHTLSDTHSVLIDAGFEYQYYASDITRVLFLKKPTPRVADVYSLLLDVQISSIRRVRPGVTLNELQQEAQRHMAEGLKALNVFEGSIEKILEQDLPRCYMHSLGHHLGLDVHDGSGLSLKDEQLKAGMVITIEPGFYFIPAYFHNHPLSGLGLRIEDDVLVTPSNYRVLSSAPKALAEILDGC